MIGKSHWDAVATDGWVVKKRRSIRVGDATIDYEVLRSKRRRKTVRLAVDARGVKVTAPMTTPNNLIKAFVEDQSLWILDHIHDEPPAAKLPRFSTGDTLPYLGRNVSMIVEPTDVRSPEVRFDHWRFKISAPNGLGHEDCRRAIRSAITSWYRERASEQLEAAVERWRRRMGHQDRSRVLVRDQRRRWGSCAFDGTLRFNWRLVMLKPDLMEYVVVHELAHLTHRDHSANFWGLVSKLLPDAPQRRLRLREEGLSLPL